MRTLKDLSDRLNKLADKVEAAPSKVAASFSLVLIDELVLRTPVDTSKALSNWLMSLNDPIYIDMDAYYEGVFGSTFSSSRTEVLKHAHTIAGRKKPGQPLYITNAAPYIMELERGTSKQAPTGFTKQSIFAAKSKLPGIIKKVLADG